jgi:hypothetical protein
MFAHLLDRHASLETIPNLISGHSKTINIGFINDLANGTPAPSEDQPDSVFEEEIVEEVVEPVQTLATAPRNLIAMSGSTRMILVWNAPHNFDQVSVDYYKIEYSYDRGRSWRALTKAAPGATEIQTSKPPVGRIVSFRITAVTPAGDSEPSNVVTTRIAR